MFENLDIKDEHDNIIIQPGLKVRHKSSQYEYTVDDVIQDPEGEITVLLKMPEEPRFTPPPEGDTVISDAKKIRKGLYEVNPSPDSYFTAETAEDKTVGHPGEEEFLAVPQDEFEKDYEVK